MKSSLKSALAFSTTTLNDRVGVCLSATVAVTGGVGSEGRPLTLTFTDGRSERNAAEPASWSMLKFAGASAVGATWMESVISALGMDRREGHSSLTSLTMAYGRRDDWHSS